MTAHRDLLPSEVPGIRRRVEDFFTDLQNEYPDLPLQLMTPLAAGGDQLVAEVAFSIGIRVVALLPMAQQDYEDDFGDAESLARFRDLLGRSDDVITLPAIEGDDPAGSPATARARLYAQVGVFTSDHCHVLLALWDGKQVPDIGGTSRVIQYHLTAVMEGLGGDPTPAGLLADNENDLVYHIVCSRDRPGGEPLDGLDPLEGRWLNSRDRDKRFEQMPAEYRTLLGRLQQFARDWREKNAEVSARSASLLDGSPACEEPGGARYTDMLFQAADGLAVHYQRRVHSSLRALHVMAILMGLIFLVYTEYDGTRYMVLTFLGLFFAGVVLHLVGSNREWHRKYLDYRTLAEGLRVQLYWNLSGVVDRGWAGFAYDNFLSKQDVDLGWIRHVMRQASMYRQRGREPDPDWVPWVIAEWVGQPESGQGQLAYYSRKEVINSASYRRTHLLGNLCLWTGILVAVILVVAEPAVSEEQHRSLLVLMGVLPLVAGVWDAYSHKKAEKELIKQYGFMSGVFKKASDLLQQSDELQFRRRVLRALGQAALDEGAEWLLIHRERPLEHGRL